MCCCRCSICGRILRWRERWRAKSLTISGWVYDIGTGEVRISENGGRVFYPVTVEA